MPKSKWVSFFLCLFLGVFGAHKFYEGRILLGVVYILTAGIFGIGITIDLIILIFKPNPYYP
ncbi:MAG: TM2 domain-containing protein [Acutalibacteraceae bacterium]